MISHLRGIIHRQTSEKVTLDVNGVGYGVSVPLSVWDELTEGEEATLYILTYVREDRLDLFGFLDVTGRTLFEQFINMSGIGPKTALELCAVPKSLLMQAIGSQEPKLLTSVKGIGKKTAEKLLLDLKSLVEKQPEIFGTSSSEIGTGIINANQDVIEALKNLGYDTNSIMNTLKNLPEDLESTEERLAAALRAM
ncbi:MAG: Holliday junction branch migration protein RuvA [Candidatus Peribacteraceae bacterium]|jgi:Holliday junction DNA helicase RuvA|nr:Holliday junction branch migration protein RuvA [Candidatus Peribacteraceae bacterium]